MTQSRFLVSQTSSSSGFFLKDLGEWLKVENWDKQVYFFFLSNGISSLKQIFYLFVIFETSLEMKDSCLLLFSCLNLFSKLNPWDWQNFHLDPREVAVWAEWLLVGPGLPLAPVKAVLQPGRQLVGIWPSFSIGTDVRGLYNFLTEQRGGGGEGKGQRRCNFLWHLQCWVLLEIDGHSRCTWQLCLFAFCSLNQLPLRFILTCWTIRAAFNCCWFFGFLVFGFVFFLSEKKKCNLMNSFLPLPPFCMRGISLPWWHVVKGQDLQHSEWYQGR